MIRAESPRNGPPFASLQRWAVPIDSHGPCTARSRGRHGARPMSDRDNKDVVLALREIAANKVNMKNVEGLEPQPRQELEIIEPIEDIEPAFE